VGKPSRSEATAQVGLVGSSRTVRRSGATSYALGALGEGKGRNSGGLASLAAAPQTLAGDSPSRSEATTQVGLVGSNPDLAGSAKG
jgi:hypothetical protein